ncbi:MAG: TerC family protein [Parvularculaceae bacterium]
MGGQLGFFAARNGYLPPAEVSPFKFGPHRRHIGSEPGSAGNPPTEKTPIASMDIFSLAPSHEEIAAFLQVVLIDLTLAGDNAVVIGLAAAGVPREKRGRAIAIGIFAATILRIVFAILTTTLLSIVGLLFAGGVLLLWVCWKMWRELAAARHAHDTSGPGKDAHAEPKPKTLAAAITQIVIADISMSLDNVLAVAGAAHEHPTVLVFGLGLSVMLMGFAATFIARLLERHRWIAYIGLAIIFFVACEMMWRGGLEIWSAGGADIVQNSF